MCSVRLSAELWLSCGSALCEPIMLNLTEQGQAVATLLGWAQRCRPIARYAAMTRANRQRLQLPSRCKQC